MTQPFSASASDSGERFFLGDVGKARAVDHDYFGAVIVGRQRNVLVDVRDMGRTYKQRGGPSRHVASPTDWRLSAHHHIAIRAC